LPFSKRTETHLLILCFSWNSWHDTQPVYSCDFQPIPPAQLKRILPFPQPHHASTTTTSTSDGALASSSTNSIGGKQGPSPASTPAPSTMQFERSTSQSGIADGGEIKASGIPTVSSSVGMANRQYRLATAGADKNVRVSHMCCFFRHLVCS
jgi:chromatin assembly factor 1 subunit B